MDDEKYLPAFELIAHAGDAKAQALMAIEAAREFDFEEAQKCLKACEEEMHKAHDSQCDMIQQESTGHPVDVNIVLVHAQDHLTMAMMAHDNAEQFIELYKTIQELKEEMKK